MESFYNFFSSKTRKANTCIYSKDYVNLLNQPTDQSQPTSIKISDDILEIIAHVEPLPL